MKINKFLSMVKKRARKLGVKRIDATNEDVQMIAKSIYDINIGAYNEEKTLVFDACVPCGAEILFFDERSSKRKVKRR